MRNAPFTIRRNEPADPVQTNQSWERPFTITGNPTFLLINQHGERTSYVPQWSFGVQRELGADTSLEVTYVGSSGIKLRRLINYNVPGPGVGNVNARRPFPQFGQFQTMNAMAHSTYNALTARLQRRFSKGLTVLGSYAYSKSIDAGSGIRTTDGDPLTPMDPYGLYRERGRSAFDFRQRITTSWLYDLPIGKGRAMALSGPADVLLGGWQLSGILTLQSGFPLSAFCGPGNIQNGGDGCRADAVGINPNLSRDQKTPTRFFNTDAFIDRLPGGETFRYGNSGRNVIDGPGIISFDFSVIKNFQFTERQRLEFRAEMFNLPNHPIFAPPGTSLRNANYGVIGATRIDSRQLQFGLEATLLSRLQWGGATRPPLVSFPPLWAGMLASSHMELAIRVQVEKLPEGLFLATSDQLSGLVAQGRTVAEALDIARDVARKLIEAQRERGGETDLPPIKDSRDYTIVVAA